MLTLAYDVVAYTVTAYDDKTGAMLPSTPDALDGVA